tara:strand:+ start:83317 stop:83742 length:426 start_codon:yes stop_codon:yes gene_type:complete
MPKIASSDDEIINCFDVMSELRPHLLRANFLATVREMEQDGYSLAYCENKNAVVAVAGYRIARNLFMGKHLYVDDLVTADKHRSKGYGETLIIWLRELALQEDCSYLHLDSGTHREQAHKFYFRQGFTITSFHFSEKLSES